VLVAPPQVRFAGGGFMALAANAVGPNQLQLGKTQSRALIAIYRDNDTANKGELAVTPYGVGAQVYSWAIVTAGACGEQVLAHGERTVTVDPGAAKLVVQNRFVIDNPTQRIRSRTGAHDIVNSVLLSAAGTNATNFSPTGRFVAWQQADQFYSIADLVSGTVVATDIINGFLAWAKADSYVIAGGNAWGAVRIKNVLVDASNLLNANPDCHACVAWSSVQVVIDADRGFALVKGGQGWKIGDLFVTTSSDDVDVEESETNDALSHIRKVYDAGYPALPTIWSLGERLALSHMEPLSGDAKAQAKFLVQHNRLASTIAVATRAPDQELIGRAIAGGGTGNIEEIKNKTQTDLAFYSLGRFGIKTLPLAALEHSTAAFGANYQRNDNLSARIDAIRARLPGARALFVKPVDFDTRCDLSTAPDKKFNIDPAEVADIWHWRGPDGDRWIVLSEFSEGSGAFPQACVVLLRESSRQSVTLLNPDGLSGHRFDCRHCVPGHRSN
jgi:hypothetical protein